MFIEKKDLIKNVRKIQRNSCAFDSFGVLHQHVNQNVPHDCNCKYGADHLVNSLGHTSPGEQTGCPELKTVSKLLMLMTSEEYHNILHRDEKGIVKGDG